MDSYYLCYVNYEERGTLLIPNASYKTGYKCKIVLTLEYRLLTLKILSTLLVILSLNINAQESDANFIRATNSGIVTKFSHDIIQQNLLRTHQIQ